jgi:hypothetical protein
MPPKDYLIGRLFPAVILSGVVAREADNNGVEGPLFMNVLRKGHTDIRHPSFRRAYFTVTKITVQIRKSTSSPKSSLKSLCRTTVGKCGISRK